MRGRLEATSGRLLSEGELVRHVDHPRVQRSLGAPNDEYWIIRGMDVAEGTKCVVVIAGERFDVRVINGTLRKR